MALPSRQAVAADFDRLAALADPAVWDHNVHYHPFLLAHLPHRPALVLDVGSGLGTLCRRLATRAERVVGLDASAGMARRARALSGPGVDLVQADALALPFAADTFDSLCGLVTDAAKLTLPGRSAERRTTITWSGWLEKTSRRNVVPSTLYVTDAIAASMSRSRR